MAEYQEQGLPFSASYYELITKDYERIDDTQWEEMLQEPRPLMPWQQEIVVK